MSMNDITELGLGTVGTTILFLIRVNDWSEVKVVRFIPITIIDLDRCVVDHRQLHANGWWKHFSK